MSDPLQHDTEPAADIPARSTLEPPSSSPVGEGAAAPDAAPSIPRPTPTPLATIAGLDRELKTGDLLLLGTSRSWREICLAVGHEVWTVRKKKIDRAAWLGKATEAKRVEVRRLHANLNRHAETVLQSLAEQEFASSADFVAAAYRALGLLTAEIEKPKPSSFRVGARLPLAPGVALT